MREAARIDYRIRLRGVPIRWTTEIAAWDPPTRFVDRQIRGPYVLWEHEHTFEDVVGVAGVADGTRCRDVVRYKAPCAWLSHRLLVDRDVERIFRFRATALGQRFAAVTTRAM